MPLTTAWHVFLAGTAGGVLLELLHWYALRREKRLPQYASSIFYWVVSALMAFAGGALAWLYFGARAEAIVAAHIGLSAPLILQKLATTVAPTGSKGVGGMGQRLLAFLRW
jgi:hypothetical protein